MQPASPSRPDRRWQALLERICERAVTELDVAYACIAVVTGPGEWVPGGASSPVADRLEEYAFTLGEGPCFDAITDHAPVLARDLHDVSVRSRWLAWSAAAKEADVRAVLALPIEAGAITAGVLSIYAHSPWHPGATQFAAGRRLADAALLVLLDMAVAVSEFQPREDGDLDELPVLLRADVHRAAGMVMVQASITIDQALARLRAHAFTAGRPLPDVAADILARRLRFAVDGDSAQ